FILDPTPKKVETIKEVSEKLGLERVNFTNLLKVEEKLPIFGDEKVYANNPIEDFLKAYRDCEFVVTDSFHGTCFAAIFNKPFITLGNIKRGVKRLESVTRWLKLTDRLIAEDADVLSNPKLFEKIDFKPVNKIMEKTQKESLQWLKDAISKMKY
ncbi:MAG: polysaccharide pyruvyl transferase family protein, partial [Clostridia bacterium]|nr:polysaccharide pyruvyl transferase family protein [Clostridia bacterium]